MTQHVELYPNVDLYTDLLPDADKLYAIIKKSEAESNGRFYLRKWEPWSIFGTYTQQKHDASEPKEYGPEYDDEKYLSDRVYEAYNTAINDYINRHQIQLPEGSHLVSSSFCKYDKDINVMENHLTMQYHTDYIISEREMPGPKFCLTCTTYINEDYDGGEIAFYINGDRLEYKPLKGTILIFPSDHPYWHAVKEINNGNKYFIRNFVMYPYSGSEQWLANQRYHGAYKWAKIEQERVEHENKHNMLYLIGDRKVSYDEYVENRENNLKSIVNNS